MKYNITVEYRDGKVITFEKKSRIKPINAHKLNDQIFHQLNGWDTIKEITSAPIDCQIPAKCPYSMRYNSNAYTDQILAQGRVPSNKPADLGEFPKTIHGRLFNTKEEYLAELHDFLNGN